MPAKRKILYIEDDPASKELLEMLFNDMPDIELFTAWSAEEGLMLSSQIHPDIIFVDINLPRMNGIEAATSLRQDPALKNVPVIAISANAIPEHIDKALAAGFDKYITKPVDLEEILAVVESL